MKISPMKGTQNTWKLRLPTSLLPFSPLMASANTFVSLLLQLTKATMLAESSFIFTPGFLHYGDVYRRESGRCRTLPFFLTFLLFHFPRFSFYINIHLCHGLLNVYTIRLGTYSLFISKSYPIDFMAFEYFVVSILNS